MTRQKGSSTPVADHSVAGHPVTSHLGAQALGPELLNQLHQLLGQELLTRIQEGEAAPAMLDVARKFLKDNGIESVATSGSHLDAIMRSLPTLEEVEESHLYDKKTFKGH